MKWSFLAALLPTLLLQGCGMVAYVGYLTTWDGGSVPFHDKPCPDCKYTYDMQTGLHEVGTPSRPPD